MSRRPDLPTQLDLLAHVPPGEGATTDAIGAAARQAGMDLHLTTEGFYLGNGYALEAALRLLRKQGWLIYKRHNDPPMHVRTPTGTTRLRAATTRMTTSPQEARTA